MAVPDETPPVPEWMRTKDPKDMTEDELGAIDDANIRHLEKLIRDRDADDRGAGPHPNSS